MSTNKQRREASRRQLEIQLRERQVREARRRRTTLIGSVVGTLVLIAAVVVIIVVTTGGNSPKKKGGNLAGGLNSPSATPSSSTPPQCGQQQFPTQKVHAAKGKAVTFAGVTVGGAADLTGKPQVTSHGTTTPKALEVKDLVVGKGAAATPTSCVNVQYDGVLYKDGKEFDSSWSRGQVAQFSLTGVVAGFTQGIGGGGTIKPMHVGGRRIIIVPAALGYGAQAQGSIPANSTLVFVVDLVKVR